MSLEASHPPEPSNTLSSVSQDRQRNQQSPQDFWPTDLIDSKYVTKFVVIHYDSLEK